eukprot:jgi/Chrzof1/8881/Cz03g27240.t1
MAACTGIMTTLYTALGAAGYWSKGHDVAEIVIFSLGESMIARLAAGCILLQAIAQYLVNLNVWTHNLLVLLGRRYKWSGTVKCSSDHNWAAWGAASVFVIAYSYAISISIPYFSALVGIVASTTYLICAYTLPCWFSLRLIKQDMWRIERWFCYLLIPVTLALSAWGLLSSVQTLIEEIHSHGSGFGPA